MWADREQDRSVISAQRRKKGTDEGKGTGSCGWEKVLQSSVNIISVGEEGRKISKQVRTLIKLTRIVQSFFVCLNN